MERARKGGREAGMPNASGMRGLKRYSRMLENEREARHFREKHLLTSSIESSTWSPNFSVLIRIAISFSSGKSILFIVAAPFISGFWVYHQWAGFPTMTIIHILSGEIMLAAIPFTKLFHMFLFPFTRGYMGSEFGGVRMAKDW